MSRCGPNFAGHIGNFLHTLFQNGAFPANRPQEAYFVRCDRTTMTQNDIDNGRVNVLVGFAAVKPAEFVILRIAISAKRPSLKPLFRLEDRGDRGARRSLRREIGACERDREAGE